MSFSSGVSGIEAVEAISANRITDPAYDNCEAWFRLVTGSSAQKPCPALRQAL
jgi:hypothetical protein